jgi:hypothetical protein
VFSFAMAGAGIRGGQVLGASDKNGAFPATDPIRPHDLTATIFHLLGIDPNGMFLDKSNRPHPLTKGEPFTRLLGNGPATVERCTPGGDVSFVPPYDDSKLVDVNFASSKSLIPVSPLTRDKGWRATPIWQENQANAFSIKLVEHQLSIGFGLGDGLQKIDVPQGTKAILAQEIRNARGGHYTFTIQASGGGTSLEFFEKVFLPNFTCRLVLFRFADTTKDARRIQELASANFQPVFTHADKPKPHTVSRFLGSTVPQANFAIGNGLGVAIIIEKSTPTPLILPNTATSQAFLRIHSVTLDFTPRERDESVTD